jgi:L-2,4-diaminobutyrate transaminase
MPQGDILGFAPPLCLTREEADIVVEKTAAAVKSVFAGLRHPRCKRGAFPEP